MKRAALLTSIGILAGTLLAGCGATERVDIGEGVHTIAYTGEITDWRSPEEVLTAEADAACPGGWTRTAEKSSTGTAGRRLDWYIRCN